MTEIQKEDIEIIVDSNQLNINTGSIETSVDKNTGLSASIVKREFSIVGDAFYATLNGAAPAWLSTIIDATVSDIINGKITSLNEATAGIMQAISEIEIAKNTYTQSIISQQDIEGIIVSSLTTINATLAANSASIIDLNTTKVTEQQALALSAQQISSEINGTNGLIKSAISSLQIALSTPISANATSIEALSSMLLDEDGELAALATADQTLYTYVGLTQAGTPDGTGLLNKVEILEKQVDGVIETTIGTYDVITYSLLPGGGIDVDTIDLVVTAEPYASWLAAETVGSMNVRLAHVGDAYIKYEVVDGIKNYLGSYKFIRTESDTTTPYGTDSFGFTWGKVVDQVAEEVYMTAINAYDLADSKRRVFTATPYVPYDKGDLWLVQSGALIIGTNQGGRIIQAGDVLRCIESKLSQGSYENNNWVPADNYRESMNAIQTDLNDWRTGTYAPFVTNIQSQVDGKAETFYQSTIPTGRIRSLNVVTNITLDKYIGDLWKNTYVGTISFYLGDNTEYVYTKKANGSNWDYDWTKMEVPDIVFDTIDTKKSIYSGNSLPAISYPDTLDINDMWITGDTPVSPYIAKSIYAWNGTAWLIPVRYTEDLDAFVDTVNDTIVPGLQSQIDGQINYYFYDSSLGQTAISVSGSASWTTDILKKEHNGDIAYDTKLEVGYWYDRLTSSWIEITGAQNAGVIEALKKAALAQSTADGKITIYSALYSATEPTGVTGKLWYDKSNASLKRYSGSAWIALSTLTEPKLSIGDLVYIYGATNGNIAENTGYKYNGTNWGSITDGGITAVASYVTDLETSITDPTNGAIVTAVSSVRDELETTILNGDTAVTSNWGYNSNINLAGVNYSSGFGLATSVNSPGHGIQVGESEFWIKADKMKMTTTGYNGDVYSPFTVDGTDGTISFNGKVSFSNVTNVPDYAPKINMVPEKYSTFSGIALPPLEIANCTIQRRTDLSYIKYGNASLMTWTTADDAYVYLGESGSDYNVSVPIGASIIISVYIKPAWTEVPVQLYIRDSSGVHYGTSAMAPAGVWTRVSFTHTTTTSSLVVRVDNDSWSELGTQSPMAIDGVMVELNESNGVPSPFVAGTSSNNDIFAQKLGYLNYADMVAKATNGQTIVTGGFIGTNMVRADSILADAATIKKLLAQNIVMDTSVTESKITSANGAMTIDFKNGSIYIA